MIESDDTGPWYLDSSALVRLYVPDQLSDQLNAAFVGRADLIASDFAITESVAAICRLRRDGLLTPEQAVQSHQSLVEGHASGAFECTPLTVEVHRATERRMMEARVAANPRMALRASDSLHLGLALSARCRGMITFDQRLAEVSATLGLDVYPPRPGKRN